MPVKMLYLPWVEGTPQLCPLPSVKGLALDCFEPALLGINDPVRLSDFELFIEELETNFGTFNPEGEAKAELEQLRMH